MELTHKTATTPKPRALPRRLEVGVSLVVVLASLTYLAICAYAADRLSQSTRRPVEATVGIQSLSYQPVQFPSAEDGIPIAGWYMDSPGDKIILMLHGESGVRNDSYVGMMDLARAFIANGYDVLTIDFRGHGESGGERVSYGQFETRDVAGALSYLHHRGASEIGVIGFSMGAVAALNAAPDHPDLRAIVADSSFADAGALVEDQLPKRSNLPVFFGPGLLLMGRLMYGIDLANDRPEDAVARLGNRPVLLIHGASDGTVPVTHAYALQKAGASDPNLQLWIVPGADHVRAFKTQPQEYLTRVIDFFNRNLK